MQLLLENYGWVDESFVNKLHAEHYDSLFKKIDIYTNNVKHGLINEDAKYIDRDIFLTEEERVATHDMLVTLQYQLAETAYERYGLVLDEGIIDGIKKFSGKVVAKAQDTLKDAKEIHDKIKTAFNILLEAIKKGFKKISELLKFFKEWLFEKLSDTLSGSIEKLGLIGEGRKEVEKDAETLEDKLNDSASYTYSYKEYLAEAKKEEEAKKSDKVDKKLAEAFAKATKDIKPIKVDTDGKIDAENAGDLANEDLKKDGEKDFFNAIVTATIAKSKEIPDADKVELNEGAFRTIVDGIKNNDLFRKIANNEVVKKIQGNKVLRFIAMILIGIISSIIITQCLPVLLSAITIALGASASGTLVTLIPIVCRAVWSSRAVLKTFANRFKDWKHAKETGKDEKFITGKFLFNLLCQLAILAATSAIPMGSLLGKIGGVITKIPFIGDLAAAAGTGAANLVGMIQSSLLTGTEKLSSAIVGQLVPADQVQTIMAAAFKNCGLANLFAEKFNYKYGHEETSTIENPMSDEDKIESHNTGGNKETIQTGSGGEEKIDVVQKPGSKGTSTAFAGSQDKLTSMDKSDFSKLCQSATGNEGGKYTYQAFEHGGKTAYKFFCDGKEITDPNTVKQIAATIQKSTGLVAQVVEGVPETVSKFVADALNGDLFPLVFSPFKRFKDYAITLSRSNASLSKKYEGNLGRGMVAEMTFKDLQSKAENGSAIEALSKLYEGLKEDAKKRAEGNEEALKKIDKIDINKNKLLVMFAKVNDKNVPFFAFSYDSMKFVDCFKAKEGETKNNKERKGLLDINGLFSHLNIMPKGAHDTETKDEIFEFLALYLQKAAVEMTKKYYLPIVEESKDEKTKGLFGKEKTKKRKVFAPAKDFKLDEKSWRKLYGLSPEEICQILNSNRKEADSQFRELTNKIFSGKRNKDVVTIEDKENYIKNKLFPILKEETSVSKAIKTDKQYSHLKEWLYDEKGNFKEDSIIPDSVDKLFRIMTSYAEDTTRSWKDLFKSKSDEEKAKDRMALNMKALAELLWNYKEKNSKVEKNWKETKSKSSEAPKDNNKTNEEIGAKALKFADAMIRRFDVDDSKSDAHKKFVKAAMKRCPLFYKDDKLDEELLKKKYVASTLQQLFNTGKYKNDDFDETAKSRIDKAVEKSSYEGDKKELKKNIFAAYKLIKEKKKAAEYKALKEGMSISDFDDFFLFEQSNFKPQIQSRQIMSFSEYLKSKN